MNTFTDIKEWLRGLKFKQKLFLIITIVGFLGAVTVVSLVQREVRLRSRADSGPAVLTIIPSSENKIVGESGLFDVLLNPNGVGVSGVQLIIEYDSSLIQIDDVKPGNFFTDIGGEREFRKDYSTPGRIEYGVVFELGSGQTSTSVKSAAIISYTTIAQGTNVFNFVTEGTLHTKVTDSEANDILASASGGNVVIEDPLVTTPTPVVTSTPSPTGVPTATPTLTPTPSPDPGVLTFRVPFQGVIEGGRDQKIDGSLEKEGDVYWQGSGFNAEVVATGVCLFEIDNSDGNIPQGKYTLKVKGPSHLKKRIDNLDYQGGDQTFDLGQDEKYQLRAGDVTNDNKLTIADVARVLRYYTELSVDVDETDHEMMASDINKDGKITIVDVALIAVNWTGLIVEGDE